jgi:hypothetical protein
MPDLVLFGSLSVERTQELRQAGFYTALLDVQKRNSDDGTPCGTPKKDGRMSSGSSTNSR